MEKEASDSNSMRCAEVTEIRKRSVNGRWMRVWGEGHLGRNKKRGRHLMRIPWGRERFAGGGVPQTTTQAVDGVSR